MNSTTQPREGAVRAASKIQYGELLPANCLNDDALAIARIIDRETGVGELVELLARVDSYWNPKTGARLERIIGTSTCNRIRQALSRHTSTQGKEGKL
jgi:hypothetical protein